MVSVIAKNLRDRRIQKALSEIFERADTSNTGSLSIPEYLELCRNYNIEVTQDDLTAIENIAENNGDGISKNDFIMFIRQSNMYAQFDTVDPESDQHWIDKTQQAWKMFDKNGDGKLSQFEFRWMTDRGTLTNREIKMMWSKCDLDGDGYLDFEEFREMIMRSRERKELARLREETEEEEELNTIEEITENIDTPETEEDIEEKIVEDQNDSYETVDEEIEKEDEET